MTVKAINTAMLWVVRITALLGPGLLWMALGQPFGRDPCVVGREFGQIDLLIGILLSLPYLHILLRLTGPKFKRGLALAVTTGLAGFLISTFFLLVDGTKGYTAAIVLSQAALVAAAIATYYLRGREAGDTRILVMGFGTVAIYLALFWLAPAVIPLFISIRPYVANQYTVVGSLRTLNTSEITYSSTYTTGFSPTLAALGPAADGSASSPSALGLIDSSLASGKAGKYMLTFTPSRDASGNITAYTISARPIIPCQGPGVPSFFTDESGVIRRTDEDRPATVHDPPLAG
jgi:type IV pilus assembly protein PilA